LTINLNRGTRPAVDRKLPMLLVALRESDHAQACARHRDLVIRGRGGAQYRARPVIHMPGFGVSAMIEVDGANIRASEREANAAGFTSQDGSYCGTMRGPRLRVIASRMLVGLVSAVGGLGPACAVPLPFPDQPVVLEIKWVQRCGRIREVAAVRLRMRLSDRRHRGSLKRKGRKGREGRPRLCGRLFTSECEVVDEVGRLEWRLGLVLR
jgi:hypothetical protein